MFRQLENWLFIRTEPRQIIYEKNVIFANVLEPFEWSPSDVRHQKGSYSVRDLHPRRTTKEVVVRCWDKFCGATEPALKELQSFLNKVNKVDLEVKAAGCSKFSK